MHIVLLFQHLSLAGSRVWSWSSSLTVNAAFSGSLEAADVLLYWSFLCSTCSFNSFNLTCFCCTDGHIIIMKFFQIVFLCKHCLIFLKCHFVKSMIMLFLSEVTCRILSTYILKNLNLHIWYLVRLHVTERWGVSPSAQCQFSDPLPTSAPHRSVHVQLHRRCFCPFALLLMQPEHFVHLLFMPDTLFPPCHLWWAPERLLLWSS